MSEQKPGDNDPIEDLKSGLGSLFRAAKEVAKKLPTDKVEDALKTGADEIQKAVEKLPTEKLEEGMKTGIKEVGRAFNNVATVIETEVEKATKKVKSEPPVAAAPPPPPPAPEPEPEPGTYDDAYAPEPDDKR